MASKAEHYQTHLDRVSRSFAFCIRQLPAPLREWVGLSYLLCRLVDTIEDSAWPNLETQLKNFERFDHALLSPEGVKELEGWERGFAPDIPEGERLLLADASRLLNDYHRFPPQIGGILRELVYSMSQGMQHFCRLRSGGELYLKTLAEVNQYCFFVAGVVGELLTKLMAKMDPRVDLSQSTLVKAHHFGLFLQKVNLLKDQVWDEKVGRHLVPSREQVEKSAQENSLHAFEFLAGLPLVQREFRRFCAWSLFLGMESLAVARNSMREMQVLKVDRQHTEVLLQDVERRLEDNGLLRELFQSLCQKLGWNEASSSAVAETAVPDWLLKLYRGPLEPKSLSLLGVAAPA